MQGKKLETSFLANASSVAAQGLAVSMPTRHGPRISSKADGAWGRGCGNSVVVLLDMADRC